MNDSDTQGVFDLVALITGAVMLGAHFQSFLVGFGSFLIGFSVKSYPKD